MTRVPDPLNISISLSQAAYIYDRLRMEPTLSPALLALTRSIEPYLFERLSIRDFENLTRLYEGSAL